MERVLWPSSFFEVPAGSFSAVLCSSSHVRNVECDWSVVAATELGIDDPDNPLLDVLRGKGEVGGVCFLPGPGVVGWSVCGLVDQDQLVVHHPVLDLLPSWVSVVVAPGRRVSIEVTCDEVIFCKKVKGVEVKLSAWGTVAVRDVKFFIL